MKRISTILILAIITMSSLTSRAQAFDKSTKIISIGLGPASMFHIPIGYSGWYTSFYSPLTGQISVQGEFAVHKYVGVGFNVGIGGRASSYALVGGHSYYSGYYSEFNIPIGAVANCHFYQIIADKTGKGAKMHSDKLDIYAGINIGSGIAIHPGYIDAYGNSTAVNDVLFWAGPQVGIHYYFTPSFGINGEIGYGKTLINGGITFKMGGGKKSKKG